MEKKKPFHKVKKKQWKRPQEEPQSRDPSSRTDRHAIDVMCTEKSNKSQFTSYIYRKSTQVAVASCGLMDRQSRLTHWRAFEQLINLSNLVTFKNK